MWKKLSLRARLSLPMVAMVLAALALGGVALQIVAPDQSAEVSEKRIGFLAIVRSGSALMLMAALSAYFTTGSAVRPLAQLRHGLSRRHAGDYESVIPLAGPPEIRKSCEAANQLAATLKHLSRDNRDLLRRLVSVQDDERREPHDELSPLLFAPAPSG